MKSDIENILFRRALEHRLEGYTLETANEIVALLKPSLNEARYRFVSDDDGHNYIIPAGMQKQFDRWLESCMDDAPPYSGFTFDENRIDSPSNYTFTDPKEDD